MRCFEHKEREHETQNGFEFACLSRIYVKFAVITESLKRCHKCECRCLRDIICISHAIQLGLFGNTINMEF
jgi:hypothetical protein